MKTISTISSVLGYTIDTYSYFDPWEAIADEDVGEDSEIDHVAYVADVANYCAEVLTKEADKILLEVTCTGSHSPREYNFSTDEAELLIRLNSARLGRYIDAHLAEFNEYLRETFTSYDGFWSYVPNNWRDFKRQLRAGGAIESDRNWAVMLGWYMRREVITEEQYVNAMYEQIGEAAYGNATNLVEEN